MTARAERAQGRLGAVSLALVLPGGTELSSLNATLEGPDGFEAQTHTIPVLEDVVPSIFFGSLAVGSYRVTLTAGECSGATTFEIEAGKTTEVEVAVTCGAPSEATATGSARLSATFEPAESPCARLVEVTVAMPAAVRARSSAVSAIEVILAAGVTAPETTWGVEGGVLQGEGRLARNLSCTEPGTANISVSVEAGGCSDVALVVVQCLPRAQPNDELRAMQASAGGYHTCALSTEGEVHCWGRNGSGQSSPPEGRFTQVSSGESHTCALSVDGEVRCWGSDPASRAAKAVLAPRWRRAATSARPHRPPRPTRVAQRRHRTGAIEPHRGGPEPQPLPAPASSPALSPPAPPHGGTTRVT